MVTETRDMIWKAWQRSMIASLKTGAWGRFGILCLILAATAMVSPAQDEQRSANSVKFTDLVNFDGTDGAEPPSMALVQGTDGNLYGVTEFGGSSTGCLTGYACGTVFKVTDTGALSTVYNFCSQADCADGANPFGGLVLGQDGNFYGTTTDGYTSSPFWGTVFKITPGGTLTTLHSFDLADGAYAEGALVQAPNGNFYGVTDTGGTNDNSLCDYGFGGGCGTIFEITPSGTLTTLYNFCSQTNCTDGANPPAGLVLGENGNLYGTTSAGGAYGLGTVYEITAQGTLTTLYSFCAQSNCLDGGQPFGLVLATDGNFYGTNGEGGMYEAGTVFKITPSGTLTTLYNLDGAGGGGYGAVGALIQGTDGSFYGTTELGGSNSDGTVFKITPGGALITLHSFDGTDGYFPEGGLFQATNGSFYGTTAFGAANSSLCPAGYNTCGTVFSMAVGLGPFVEPVPTSGKIGSPVKILGSNLTGATSVSFNGVAAVFKVVSRTLISATVPAGATSGFVTVTTPGGTLKSNVKFRVRP